MNKSEQINTDFITAMKERNTIKKTFLGLLKSEIKNNEGRGIEASDVNVTKVVVKMNKSLKEVLDAGNKDAIIEMEWLLPYMPKAMSIEKIREEVQILIDGGAKNIGMVMGQFNKKFASSEEKADNNEVKNAAQELMSIN